MPVAVTPKLLCASLHCRPLPGQYIARSAMIGWLATMVVDAAALASSGLWSSMFTVSRALAATV